MGGVVMGGVVEGNRAGILVIAAEAADEAFWLLPALRDGRPAVIDELASDLHPHMLTWILRLFTAPVINPKNAQLFFTCHSVEVLNEPDKTQIYLVGKDPSDNVSMATRLDEIQGVRRDDNLFAKYNAGLYGALPELE
jgi:predicted ATPase